MKKMIVSSLAALFSTVVVQPALAQAFLNQPPTNFSRLRLTNMTVPVPPGDWREIGRDTDRANSRASTTYTTVLLGLWENNTLVALLDVETNDAPSAFGGFNVPSICNRQDVLFIQADSPATNSYDCMVVNHTTFRPGTQTSQRWTRLYQTVEANRGMPRTTISVSYSIGQNFNYLSYRLHLNPEASGFPRSDQVWADNDWHRLRISPDRKAYVERVRNWALGFKPLVQRGASGRL